MAQRRQMPAGQVFQQVGFQVIGQELLLPGQPPAGQFGLVQQGRFGGQYELYRLDRGEVHFVEQRLPSGAVAENVISQELPVQRGLLRRIPVGVEAQAAQWMPSSPLPATRNTSSSEVMPCAALRKPSRRSAALLITRFLCQSGSCVAVWINCFRA